jgi:hypothetical protein
MQEAGMAGNDNAPTSKLEITIAERDAAIELLTYAWTELKGIEFTEPIVADCIRKYAHSRWLEAMPIEHIAPN